MLQGTYNERRTSVRRKVDDPSIDVIKEIVDVHSVLAWIGRVAKDTFQSHYSWRCILCGDGASWDFIQNNTAQAQ